MKKLISIITLSLVSVSALAEYQFRDPAVYQSVIFKADDMVTENNEADAYALTKENKIDKMLKRYTHDKYNGCGSEFRSLNSAASAAYDTKNGKALKRIEVELERLYGSCNELKRSTVPQPIQQPVQQPQVQATAGKPFINPSLPNAKVYSSKVYQASPYDLLNHIKEDNTLACDVKFRVLNALSSEYSEADRAPITYSLTELAEKCGALQTKSSTPAQPVSTFVWQKHKVNAKQAIDLIYETITIDLQDGVQPDKDYFKSLFTNELPCSVKPTIVDAVKKLAVKLQNEGGPMFLNHVTDAANEIGCK